MGEDERFERAREAVGRARRVVALTGAGISAESGIPTFRGSGGLWRMFRPEDLATPEAFARDPRLVWEWYDWRRGLVAAAEPNDGHRALVELEARCEAFTLVTQNVDGLHHRAGSRHLIPLHGDLWTLRCTGCGAERIDRRTPLPELPPRCSCGAIERPGVVWFGESLPEGALERGARAVRDADLFLLVGTSAAVWPAAGLAEVALEARVPVIEVNPEATPFSDRVLALRGRAGDLLPRLLAGPAPSGAAPAGPA
jgi:NAD-dependent protein deacetylase/lipoamidase